MKQLLFATGNNAKLAQLRFVVERCAFPIDIVSARDTYGVEAAYDEIGMTVADVAKNGALFLAAKLRVPIMTEDTDLRVAALDDAPGIRAGEFLKQYGRDEILHRMNGIDDRRAVINSAVAYATPDGDCKLFVHHVNGRIARAEVCADFPSWIAPSAENIFGGGYNAIFVPDGWNKTLAEISPEEALPWSYRERNFIDVAHYILAS